MWYISNTNELYHHGIKGQKWGVRNGPPYPLGSGQHSKAEMEAEKPRRKEKGSGSVDKHGIDPVLATYLAISVATVAAPLISLGISKIKDKNMNKKISEIVESRGGKVDPESGLHLKNNKTWSDSDLKNVNPQWDGGKTLSVSNNCVMCSMAVEMRRRGYDVSAKASSQSVPGLQRTAEVFPGGKAKALATNLYNQEALKDNVIVANNEVFLSAEFQKSKYAAIGGANTEYAKKAIAALSKEPNSRGSIFVNWGAGGGHAMAYEVSNGKVKILDGQSSKVYTGNDLEKLLAQTIAASYYRTDNLKIDFEKTKEVVI